MHTKRLAGLVLFFIGLALLIFSLYAKGRLAGARGDIGHAKSVFGKNTVTDVVGGVAEGKVAQYDQPVFWCQIGGIVLMVIGGGIIIACRKKKKRR